MGSVRGSPETGASSDMGSPERRAVLLLFGLALLGQGVLTWRSRSQVTAGADLIPDGVSRVSPDAQRVAAVAADRPLAPGEKLDPDLVTAKELMRLPGVGPTLAERIVVDRDANGPFRTIEGLDRVPGVGPATIRRLAPHLRFAGAPARPELVDLNRADAEALASLPGIGPARARAIVAWRMEHGPFRSMASLTEVRGVGPALVEGLAGMAVVR